MLTLSRFWPHTSHETFLPRNATQISFRWLQHGRSGATGTPPKLGWNRGELELNYRGYMWADLIFIPFRPLAAVDVYICSDGPCRFLNIGDTDNICDILSP